VKAIVYRRYGPAEVLELVERPEPTPARGQVRVRVEAASMNPKDVLVRKGKLKLFTRWNFPRIPGHDVAGVVDALGPGVSSLAVGDEVFGMIGAWSAGAHAESVVMPERELAPKPASRSMIEAAAVPLAALTALQALRDRLRVEAGARVLLNGASGGVGVFAVQLAKILGAHVTATCSSRNVALVRELGADRVVPYDEVSIRALRGRAEPGERVERVESAAPFDAVFDIFGSAPYREAASLLAPRGRYATAIPRIDTVARDLATRLAPRKAGLVVVRSDRDDLAQLARWIDAGRLRVVIDRVFPLSEAADAHRYIETKRARGKVVLAVR
jgi:NADPH:quinone reductase-like Zn-dependent oxidoreductase